MMTLFDGESESNEQKKPKRSAKQREMDVLHDALAELFFPDGAGPDDHKRIGKVVRNLREKRGITPDEIRHRFANYPKKYPDCSAVSIEGFGRLWDQLAGQTRQSGARKLGQWALDKAKEQKEQQP